MDQDRDVHLELTPGHLALQVSRNPAMVALWRPDLRGEELTLEPLSRAWNPKGQDPQPERWACQRQGSRLTLQTDTRLWNLEKKTDAGRPRRELTGLWRQVRQTDQKIDYVEFTPWSTVVSLTWQPENGEARPGQAPATRRIAEWWSYTSPEEGVLMLEGVSRSSARSILRAGYTIESNTVTLNLNGTVYTLRKTDRVE